MKLPRSLILVFLFISGTLLAQKTVITVSPFSIGEQLSFNSNILEEQRQLNVYLPASYGKDSLQAYPVIYLLDGSAEEDFIHIAGLVQFGTFPWINMLPESIVVGIANVDRKRDFTFPSSNPEDQEYLPTSGGAGNFLQFISEEVMPLIEKQYRTSGHRSLIGQSLGGLLATEVIFLAPGLFDKYIIVSPSLWWDNGSLLQQPLDQLLVGTDVFVAVGKEGPVMEKAARDLYDKLSKIATEDNRVFFKFLADQDHGDALHLAVYHAFAAFYPKEE